MVRKTLYFKDGSLIKIWIDKDGVRNNFVELEFNLSRCEDKVFFKKMRKLSKDLINSDGVVLWPGTDETGFRGDIKRKDFFEKYSGYQRGYNERMKTVDFFKMYK